MEDEVNQKEPMYLHAVVIDKGVGIAEAKKSAQKIMNKKRQGLMLEDEKYFRFRNIPKTYFDKKTFKSHKINESVTLVFGKLKDKTPKIE